MVLHVIKASLPVQFDCDGGAHWQRRRCRVHHSATGIPLHIFNAGCGAIIRHKQATIGRLAAGGAADVLVCDHVDDDPFRNLIAAREKDVRLVLVRGTPFYGTKSLMKAAGEPEPQIVAAKLYP